MDLPLPLLNLDDEAEAIATASEPLNLNQQIRHSPLAFTPSLFSSTCPLYPLTGHHRPRSCPFLLQRRNSSNRINYSTMSDTMPKLSDGAAFMLAVAEFQAMATEKQQLYDDPSCTAEQRLAMVLELAQKWVEASVIEAAIRRQNGAVRLENLTDTAERLEMLDAIYKRSILKHLDLPVIRKQDVIPIKLQMLYWLMSTLFVLLSQRLVLESFAQTVLSLSIVLALMVFCSTKVSEGKTVAHLAWYAVYGFVFAVGKRYIQPLLLGDAVDTLTARETLVFHWRNAFFVISEAEWHRHLYKTMTHPVYRDIMPVGNCKASTVCRSLGMLLIRFTLATYIPLGFVPLICGVDFPSMAPSMFLARWRIVSSTPQWFRRVPQVFVLMRPMHQLTAWLVDKVVEMGSHFYRIFNGDIPVSPQQANTEVGIQTVE